jgi:hypothetical protein
MRASFDRAKIAMLQLSEGDLFGFPIENHSLAEQKIGTARISPFPIEVLVVYDAFP